MSFETGVIMRDMRKIKGLCQFFALTVFFFCLTPGVLATDFFAVPPPSPPEEYGNILIIRNSEGSGMRAVAFSHWSHRMKYTCRVCHGELEFNFRVNTTNVTEQANKDGRYCGACHNGKEAFGLTKENCDKCHSGDRAYNKDRFKELERLPDRAFGNDVDWTKALENGSIKPKNSLSGDFQPMSYDKKLVMPLEWGMIPPAIFPHKSHVQWLDCSDCHPGIFNIKMRTTKHFSMARNLKGEFCGVCHLTGPAFPMDDCKRCHPH